MIAKNRPTKPNREDRGWRLVVNLIRSVANLLGIIL